MWSTHERVFHSAVYCCAANAVNRGNKKHLQISSTRGWKLSANVFLIFVCRSHLMQAALDTPRGKPPSLLGARPPGRPDATGSTCRANSKGVVPVTKRHTYMHPIRGWLVGASGSTIVEIVPSSEKKAGQRTATDDQSPESRQSLVVVHVDRPDRHQKSSSSTDKRKRRVSSEGWLPR